MEALALAIDAKDQTSQLHIRRVQLYAAALARALGTGNNKIRRVKTAALLHGIGKLAVPEHILSKPGPLTQEEFQKIRIHPQVGAELISGVPFPYPVAPLILSHHERFDGKGYPAGLKGEDIPLGARILSAVDYFDALMSERPYHKAMSFDAAIGLLRQESGKALDPRVVQTFIEMYPALAAETDASQEPARKLTRGAEQPPAARQRAAQRRFRSGGRACADVASIRAGLPARLHRAVHRHDRGLPHRGRDLHRRSPAAARSHFRAGRGGHLQLDGFRANARG